MIDCEKLKAGDAVYGLHDAEYHIHPGSEEEEFLPRIVFAAARWDANRPRPHDWCAFPATVSVYRCDNGEGKFWAMAVENISEWPHLYFYTKREAIEAVMQYGRATIERNNQSLEKAKRLLSQIASDESSAHT